MVGQGDWYTRGAGGGGGADITQGRYTRGWGYTRGEGVPYTKGVWVYLPGHGTRDTHPSTDSYVFLLDNGVFTLPDTESDTDTDKKWVIKNYVEVFTLQRHNNAIEYCYNLLVFLSVSVSVSGSVNAPQRLDILII